MKIIQVNKEDVYENYRYMGISAILCEKSVTKKLFDNILQLSEKEKVIIQLFDSEKIATWKHIFIATLNAIAAFKQSRNIASQLSLEILLYATGQRQIRDAINILGVSEQTRKVAILILGDSKEKITAIFSQITELLNGKEEEKLLEIYNEEKLQQLLNTFKITKEELDATIRKEDKKEAIVKCILDRVSVFAVEK